MMKEKWNNKIDLKGMKEITETLDQCLSMNLEIYKEKLAELIRLQRKLKENGDKKS